MHLQTWHFYAELEYHFSFGFHSRTITFPLCIYSLLAYLVIKGSSTGNISRQYILCQSKPRVENEASLLIHNNQNVMRAREKQQLKYSPFLRTPCITCFAVQYKVGFCHSSFTALFLYRAADCSSQLAESPLETQRGSLRVSGGIQVW